MKETTITPELAEILLAKNNKNRSIKKKHVDFLCAEIVAGRWKTNGDAIRISREGTLLDGQHRLEAVRRTGISIRSFILSGLDQDVFDSIDSGVKRSHGDVLSIYGEKNGRNLAAALIVVDSILNKRYDLNRTIRTSNAEIIGLLEKYPSIRQSMEYGRTLLKLAPPAIVVGLHYLFSRENQILADRFFMELISGADLAIDCPVYALRSRLIDNLSSKAKLSRKYMAALFIKTWNSYTKDIPIKSLRWRENGPAIEKFPELDLSWRDTETPA
jgi:hypothetical protein